METNFSKPKVKACENRFHISHLFYLIHDNVYQDEKFKGHQDRNDFLYIFIILGFISPFST